MLATKSNSYTFQKSGIWYFSRRVPADLRRHYRTGRIAYSLRTKSIDAQVCILLSAKDRVLHSALLFGLLTGMRSGEICGLMAENITAKGNLGRFVSIRPNAVRLLKSKAAEREVPLHGVLEGLLDTTLPRAGRLFPSLTVDRIVKRYAYLRRRHPELSGTVFHSTRKWFITQCERTGVPEHFTASLVGHQSARSANKLTYGLYSAGISDAQKREIVEGVRLPQA
jgi:integrase